MSGDETTQIFGLGLSHLLREMRISLWEWNNDGDSECLNLCQGTGCCWDSGTLKFSVWKEIKKRNMVINNVCFNLLVFLFSPLYFILVELDSYTCSAFIIHKSPEEPLAAEGLLILERMKMKIKKLFQESPIDTRMESWQWGFVLVTLQGRFLSRKP